MPQASDVLRQRMIDLFGTISDGPPANYLQHHGFTLHRDWTWSKPGVTGYDQLTQDEYDCMRFLVHEWDFDGLQKIEHPEDDDETGT